MVHLNNLINIPIKFLYETICFISRAYAHARNQYDAQADIITAILARSLFLITHGYIPRFKKPITFSEKIFHRMLYSRDKTWTNISDKLFAREYAGQLVGEEILVPLLWTGTNPEYIPFDLLPIRFVIKMNHGCGYNIFIDKEKGINFKEVIKKLTLWAKENYCLDRNAGLEWGYKNIKPKIFIEEFIEENGKAPNDFKFFCFSGRVEYIQISFDRFKNPSERILDRDFNALDVYNGVKLYDRKIERPVNFSKMIEISETLSRGFDFIRVDLYNIKGKIYFGELTCYPAGGLAPFIPRKWDYIFGEKWKMSGLED